MKVLHLNFYDIEGGTGLAVYRLHSLLKKNNSIDSNILVFSKQQKEANDIISFPTNFNKLSNKIKRKFCFNLTKFQKIYSKSTHSLNIFDSGIIKKINKIKPDIVHLHWINNEFISINEIKKINQPIVWTFHDMWPFCGAEHYTFEKRFIEGYLKENKPKENTGIDLNKFIWNLKKKNWKSKSFEIVCVSEWLSKQVLNSELFKDYSINTIAPPLDFSKWKDIDKHEARKKLNLDVSKTYLLFGAAGGTKDRRKGFDLLIDSLNQKLSKDKKIHLLLFGRTFQKDLDNLNLPKTNFGPIRYDDYEKLSLIYSASNLTLLPSKLEAFGQVGTESLACKTPIVTFKNSGPEDMVEHKKNGYLANYLDKKDFLNGIDWYLNLSETEIAKVNNYSREFVLKKFSEEEILNKYLKIYNNLI
tara:strand:+ start:83 stop:1330 length:1248 start_codon:yes stop_codon:yes gene_type:complete